MQQLGEWWVGIILQWSNQTLSQDAFCGKVPRAYCGLFKAEDVVTSIHCKDMRFFHCWMNKNWVFVLSTLIHALHPNIAQWAPNWKCHEWKRVMAVSLTCTLHSWPLAQGTQRYLSCSLLEWLRLESCNLDFHFTKIIEK